MLSGTVIVYLLGDAIDGRKDIYGEEQRGKYLKFGHRFGSQMANSLRISTTSYMLKVLLETLSLRLLFASAGTGLQNQMGRT